MHACLLCHAFCYYIQSDRDYALHMYRHSVSCQDSVARCVFALCLRVMNSSLGKLAFVLSWISFVDKKAQISAEMF
jgi:hypothetical protein